MKETASRGPERSRPTPVVETHRYTTELGRLIRSWISGGQLTAVDLSDGYLLTDSQQKWIRERILSVRQQQMFPYPAVRRVRRTWSRLLWTLQDLLLPDIDTLHDWPFPRMAWAYGKPDEDITYLTRCLESVTIRALFTNSVAQNHVIPSLTAETGAHDALAVFAAYQSANRYSGSTRDMPPSVAAARGYAAMLTLCGSGMTEKDVNNVPVFISGLLERLSDYDGTLALEVTAPNTEYMFELYDRKLSLVAIGDRGLSEDDIPRMLQLTKRNMLPEPPSQMQA